MIYGGSQNKGEAQGEKGRRTLTMPSMPQAAAMTSPQYLSLHHDMLQPPSAYQCVRYANTNTGRQCVPRVYLSLVVLEAGLGMLAAAARVQQEIQSFRPMLWMIV